MKKTKKLILVLLFTYLVSLFHIPNVSASACGYISNVEVDSFHYGYDYGGWSRLVKINNTEYYLQSTINGTIGSGNWMLRTIHIWNDNGTIANQLHDKYDIGGCWFMGGDMVHYKNDIYVTVGANPSNEVRVLSWRVWDNNGTIKRGSLGYCDLTQDMQIKIDPTHAYNFESANMVILDNDVIVIAFTDRTDSNKLYLTSLLIDDDGVISNEKDIISVATGGWYPQLVALDSNTIAVSFIDTADTGWIKTYDVDIDGDIGDADDHHEDTWHYETTSCQDYSNTIEHLYGAIYLIGYVDSSNYFVMKTLRIYDNGIIVESFIDNTTTPKGGNVAEFFRINEDIMAVAYRSDNSDGYIRTFNVTYTGLFDDTFTFIDEFEYWDAVTIMTYPSVAYINDTYLVVSCERYNVNEMYKKVSIFTFEIECATGGMGGIGKLYVNCYDETDMTPIDFNISFFDSNWGNEYHEVYCNTSCECLCEDYCCCDCTDSWNVSFDVLPQGTDCYIIVGNGSYHDRYFRVDIYDEFIVWEGQTYYYLCIPVLLAPETAHLYTLKAVNNFYSPLDNVEIRVKKFINENIGVIDISNLLTDSVGEAQIYLTSLYPYIFNCSRDDYYPVDFVWIPPDAENVTKTFKMTYMFDEGPDIENISMEQLVLTAYNTTTMEIFYLNLNEDNQYVDISVYDYFNDSFLLTTYHVTENPNNITQLFTWTDYELVGDILKVTAVATRINESTYTLTGYFNIQQAREQVGDAYLHLILSVGLCFFGLTIASPKTIFGPVGIIVMIIGLGVTAFAVQTWYIHLIQAVEIILLIFIVLVFKEEGAHTV